MNKFFIEEGKNTPKIDFDLNNNHFEISGKSFPENARNFYEPVIDIVEKFIPTDDSAINIDIKFHYVSTASIISILELLKLFKIKEEKGYKILVNWYHYEEDDDIRRTGEDLANLSELQFRFITY